MPPSDFPGEFEQVVLLAILRRDDEAFALEILEELEATAERSVSRGALYRTLDRMTDKGWVEWEVEESTPDRGGHRRRRFGVTPAGLEVLRHSRTVLRRLWDGLDPLMEDRAP